MHDHRIRRSHTSDEPHMVDASVAKWVVSWYISHHLNKYSKMQIQYFQTLYDLRECRCVLCGYSWCHIHREKSIMSNQQHLQSMREAINNTGCLQPRFFFSFFFFSSFSLFVIVIITIIFADFFRVCVSLCVTSLFEYCFSSVWLY